MMDLSASTTSLTILTSHTVHLLLRHVYVDTEECEAYSPDIAKCLCPYIPVLYQVDTDIYHSRLGSTQVAGPPSGCVAILSSQVENGEVEVALWGVIESSNAKRPGDLSSLKDACL